MVPAFVAEALGVRGCFWLVCLFIIKMGARDPQRALHDTQDSLLGYCMPLTTQGILPKLSLEGPGLPLQRGVLASGGPVLAGSSACPNAPVNSTSWCGALCPWLAVSVCTGLGLSTHAQVQTRLWKDCGTSVGGGNPGLWERRREGAMCGVRLSSLRTRYCSASLVPCLPCSELSAWLSPLGGVLGALIFPAFHFFTLRG